MNLVTGAACAEGHPNKVADQISDVVVDAFLSADSSARVACETMVTTNRIILAGEVRGPDGVIAGLEETVRLKVRALGFEQAGFHWNHLDFACFLHGESNDIAMGVDAHGNWHEGAGETASLSGYATDETPELMPAAQQFAHNIVRHLSQARHSGALLQLESDGRCEVIVAFEDDQPVGINSIVLAIQHEQGLTPRDVNDIVRPYIIAALPEGFVTEETIWHVNPSGNFVIGGPDGDCGLTGRQTREDSYGAALPSGVAFSGKDPTKLDRSGSYACRYLAKNVVAAGLARRCSIRMGYVVGVAAPMLFGVDLHGTGLVDERSLERVLPELIGGATPRAIREHLDLQRPIYERTAAFGHFGRQPDPYGGFSWERTSLSSELRRLADLGSLGVPRPREIVPSSTLPGRQDTDAIVFSTQCTSVTIELAKASLEFFTRILRQQLPGVPIRTELHEADNFMLELIVNVPPESRHDAVEELEKYLSVVKGEASIEDTYDDPIMAAQVRLQRSHAAVILHTRIEMLTLEKEMLSGRMEDLRERLTDLRSTHVQERVGLERQIETYQSQVRVLIHELARYASRTPDIVMESLRLVGHVAVKPAQLSELIAVTSELKAAQGAHVANILESLRDLLVRAQQEQSVDSAKLNELIQRLKKAEPTMLKKLSSVAAGASTGVLGNAVWAAIQRAITGGWSGY